MELYFDTASTTKPKKEVIDAMKPYIYDKWYNPSSLYGNAQCVKRDIDKAKKRIANFINAEADEIYFTSGGSESNSWAIQGFCHYWNKKEIKPIIITTTIEHKSIMNCVDNAIADVKFISVDKCGFVNLNELENILKDSVETPTLVSVQYANNEIGTIQHINKISELAHKYESVFHTDAVQAFGKIPIDVKNNGIDLMSVSGHKIGVPKGIGFLYIKNGIKISPLIYGTQMNGMRGGTENVAGIIGMEKAIELISLSDIIIKTTIRSSMIDSLQYNFPCIINGSVCDKFALPDIISVTFEKDISGESLVYLLDTSGIYISSGSACNSHSDLPSYVLKAIGLSDAESRRTIRISLDSLLDGTVEEMENSVFKLLFEMKRQITLLSLGE